MIGMAGDLLCRKLKFFKKIRCMTDLFCVVEGTLYLCSASGCTVFSPRCRLTSKIQ